MSSYKFNVGSKEISKFIDKVVEHGFTVVISKHVKVSYPNGNFAFWTPKTPGDFRSKVKRESDFNRALKNIHLYT